MEPAEEQVVLVDENDCERGLAGKWEAHRDGALHRAVSVLIHDGGGRMLLQKRQAGKYHSQGLWSNACCSHPRHGEDPLEAARRRLREEMGIDCALNYLFRTIYREEVGNDLIEHELVHVFLGLHQGPVQPNPVEADGYQWIGLDELRCAMAQTPTAYSPWWRIYMRDHGAAIAAAMKQPA